MAALLGNQTLTGADLKQFHIRLIPEMESSSKVSPDLVIRAVVNYIRTLLNIDDIDAQDILDNSPFLFLSGCVVKY